MATIFGKLDAACRSNVLTEHFPSFIVAFGPLSRAIKEVFSCGLDERASTRVDVIIYGLGRLCLEDFSEILFLAEHDYGYAAIKLLRGLYERAVVSEVIVESPQEQGEKFFNYYAIDAMKFQNRAKDVYNTRWTINDGEFKDSFDAVKQDYKYQKCKTCGRISPTAWTDCGLDALAGNLGKCSHDADLCNTGKELKKLYLICASLPNSHIHASMWSIFQRLINGQEGQLVFNEGSQLGQVEYALSQAHGLMTLVLHTQNEYFKLGLDDTLQGLRDDWGRTWPGELQKYADSSILAQERGGEPSRKPFPSIDLD